MYLLKSTLLSALILLYSTIAVHSMPIELDDFSGYRGDFSEYSTVVECNLGKMQQKKVVLIRGDHFYKGYYYAINMGKEIVPLGKFLIYNDYDERDFGKSYSDSLYAGCFGDKEKVLVIYGGFGGNRADALVLRYNDFYKEFESIHMRVKSWQTHIYLKNSSMLQIVEHKDITNNNVSYEIGQYIGGKGQVSLDDAEKIFGTDKIPNKKGYTVIPINLKRIDN